jgi:hypothetical protein
VLYGCETWSLTLEEKHRLRVFENRVLRRISGPIREEDSQVRILLGAWMCVCVFLCCLVLCVGTGPELDWSPNQGILPNVCGSRSPLRKAKDRKDCRSQLEKKEEDGSWRKLHNDELHAGPNGRAVCGTYCFLPFEHWDRGFESHSRHGCVSAFFCVVLSCVSRALRRADPPSEYYQLSK